jgi:carbohydrate-selective porin OprB
MPSRLATTSKLIPGREDDFLGISYGIFKGARNNEESPAYIDEENERPGHKHEQVIELVYNLQVNDYLRIMPHYQFIQNPAYRSASSESIWGVQSVFSF